ncbi:uncharacterized protein LOC132753346 isoform X2 [Ruditapes philippinarum]|uniref:uncharacterized protein LOC132753346 isoform X2 n=1 Tax=Ruditapes philippinarum TaxID=129788 RepID=UPI00295B4DC8|nr:uncharacterized protein LOC132753346 isoform X2 [Ruditapes philippinarum]
MLLTYFILFFANSLVIKAYRPDGYIGCFRDWSNRILTGKSRISKTNNSGDECIKFCKADSYRYAGTESKDECFCGHTLRVQMKVSDCTHVCTGNINEICGGHWKISVYDISLIKQDTTTAMYSSRTTKEMKLTTRKTTKSDKTLTYVRTSKTSSNGSTQTISNITLETTQYPYSGLKEGSSKLLVIVYVAAPLSFVALILTVLLIGFARRRRIRKEEKKTCIEKISQGTGSIPNIYANIIVSTGEQSDNNKSENLQGNVKSTMNERQPNVRYEYNEKNQHVYIDDIDNYDSIRQHNKNVEQIKNPYHLVANSINDESYSVCYQFSNGNKDAENTYAHIKDTDSPPNSTYKADIEVNDYNTLQLKANPDNETDINTYGANESEYDTTYPTSSMRMDEENYSHMVEVALEQYDSTVKAVARDYRCYDDNEYSSVETQFKTKDK